MASPAYKDASELEVGHSEFVSEKELVSRGDSNSQSSTRQHQALRENMPSARRLLLVLSLSLLVIFGVATAVSPGEWAQRSGQHEGVEGGEDGGSAPKGAPSFRLLVEHASPESLHDLLHKYFPDRFKHGIWPSEHSAIEAVHRNDAVLATSIAQLAKRDDTNTTATPPPSTSPPSSDPTTAPTSSSGDDTAAESNPPTTSTGDSDPPTSSGDSSTPPPSSSSPPPNSDPPTSDPPTSNAPTSDPPSTSPEPTSTSSKTSSTSSHHSRPTTATFTSTNSDGGLVIVTATSYVDADPAETGAASSTRPSGSLQTNAAPLRHGRNEVLGAMAAGVVVAGGILLV
ncbi:hypothetical protein QBC33DRAFT_267559 [Phialemonium atrogriseum]|uniref:Uncharacterized protein n=1 Tax=Phialemonium atrogriseum TaxID=1093897 RepID=A0AAJ0C845_9PEZI|nr:uncharacterized protein QBC33DRAFT_267559 [Phialemonium atrogriseum]KAK1770467.1 hypothetical protein QBC33DRAFT_267559 [Phialemonium atrogriseum]